MQEIIKILIGILILVFGIPIGNYLNKKTEDEQKQGQKWFKLLIFIGLIGGFMGLVVGIDWIMFGFFFITIITSRSLVTKNIPRKNKLNLL